MRGSSGCGGSGMRGVLRVVGRGDLRVGVRGDPGEPREALGGCGTTGCSRYWWRDFLVSEGIPRVFEGLPWRRGCLGLRDRLKVRGRLGRGAVSG